MRNASISVLAAALVLTTVGAAHAASWSRGESGTGRISGTAIALGANSISQQTDSTPGTEGVACGNESAGSTTENSFYRRFYLSEHGAGSSATISAVTIALRDGNSGANAALPITVNLYTIPASTPVDTIPLAALTQIGSATLNLSVPEGNDRPASRSRSPARSPIRPRATSSSSGPTARVRRRCPASIRPTTRPPKRTRPSFELPDAARPRP